jgi:hypothetical protein
MRVSVATAVGSGPANEDLVLAGPDFALVLDGATAEPGADTGCRHDVCWFVAELGARLTRLLLRERSSPLPDLLYQALDELAVAHRHTCDLANPNSPTATVALLRQRGDQLDHLLLCDCVLLFEDSRGDVRVLTDDRLEKLIHLSWQDLRRHRNAPGGFWVAGSRPEAARHALVGTRPVSDVRRVMLLSDGAFRLVERFGVDPRVLLDLADKGGPEEVITRTRMAERRTEPGSHPGKHHDDATVALCCFGTVD